MKCVLRRNTSLGLTLAVMASACASLYPANISPAWQAFKAFESEIERSAAEIPYENHLSDLWVQRLESADASERDQLLGVATYPGWLERVHNRLESTHSDQVCLTVNGFAASGSPGTLAVRYVEESGRLKAEEIHYQYWESEEDFPASPKCPDAFVLSFPDESSF